VEKKEVPAMKLTPIRSVPPPRYPTKRTFVADLRKGAAVVSSVITLLAAGCGGDQQRSEPLPLPGVPPQVQDADVQDEAVTPEDQEVRTSGTPMTVVPEEDPPPPEDQEALPPGVPPMPVSP
jgi:hypothetical protein